MDEIRAALERINPAVADNGEYQFWRNLTAGLEVAVLQAGGTYQDALDLITAHSPQFAQADAQVGCWKHSISERAFWAKAKDAGHAFWKWDGSEYIDPATGNGTGITETAVSGGGDTDGVIRAWHISATEEDAAAINAAGFHAMSVKAARASKIDWKGLTVFLTWDSLTLAQGPAPHGEVRTLAFDLEKAGAKVRMVLIPCEVPTAGGNCTPEVWCNTPASFIEHHGTDAFRVLTEFARHCVEKEQDPNTKKWKYSWVWEKEVKQTREKALIAWTVFKDHFLVDAETGALHRWVGTHWNGEDGGGEKALQGWLSWWLVSMRWRNTSTVGEVSHELVRRLLVKMPADVVAEKGILPCRNGCLRLADRVLLSHAPEMGNTWVLSYGYDPAATAQPILDFLHECLENREDVQVLRAGLWAAVRRLGVKALLELVGKGDSGKSVVASLAIALVGDADTGVSTLERIEDPRQRFETVKMRGKALAIFNEVQNYVGPLEVLKAMTGRDRISAELKNSTANVDFVFHGLIMLVGNGPLRSTDRSSAVINRRRTISAPHAVPVEKQRPMMEKNAAGEWVGELSGSLSGFLNWVLDTDPAEAKRMLSNATGSLARIEAELVVLLEDPLAEWAEDFLVFDQSQGPDGKPVHSLGIGTITGSHINGGSLGGERERFAFPAYRQWMEEEKHGCVPISGKVFKECLVKLLRDSLRLPLPGGSLKRPPYKHRIHGSRIPFVRWRTAADGEVLGSSARRNIAR